MLTTYDHDEDLQADIVRAFERGEVEGVPTPVERIDTNLNHVFLAGDRVYKIKRARRLPFVDFRSLEQRRKACEAELAINRRLGSPFYLAVERLVRRGKAFAFGHGENAAEWVVAMKRFHDDQRFDLLAAAGRIGLTEAEDAARMIADMHAKAPVFRSGGHAADYRQVIHNLRRTEEDGAAAQGLSISGDRLYEQLDNELSRIDPLIEERRDLGRVRRAHGDLHLGNICLFEGRPTAFDALEFDERMATTDVLYDLAFFLMDLTHCGLRREANAAMNCYWEEARESESALALLPFFVALRAAVRMAVAVESGDLEGAHSYRSLALQLLKHDRPKMLAIGGLSGVGKSALAREVAPLLPGGVGARIIRSDVVRKRSLGIGVEKQADRGAYAPERRAATYREMLAYAAAAAGAGASVVVDATFQAEGMRETLAAALPAARRIWLEAPLDLRLARVGARMSDASDADVSVAVAQEAIIDPGPDWERVDAGRPLADIAEAVLKGSQ